MYTIHIIKYYTAVKMNGLQLYASTWMNLKSIIMLNKKGKLQMNTFSIFIRSSKPNEINDILLDTHTYVVI